MRLSILLTIPPLLLIGCASAPSGTGKGICDGTERLRTEHAAALVEDGGPQSQVTGARLIGAVDAACE